MSQNPSNAGNSQYHSHDHRQIPTQHPVQAPTQNPAPNSGEDRTQSQNELLNALTAVLLNEFLSKARLPVASSLGSDMTCTICTEAFLRGENPEVPVRLDCGHVFGMNCILKWLSPVSRNGNNSCPNCRRPIFDEWENVSFLAPRQSGLHWMRGGHSFVRIPIASRNVERGPVPSSQFNTENTRAPPAATAGAADVPRDGRRRLPYPPWVRPLAAEFPRPIRARRSALTGVIGEAVDASANTSSASATPRTVAPNTLSLGPVVATREAQDQQQVVQGPHTVAGYVSRTHDLSAPNDTTSRMPPPPWLASWPAWMERRPQRDTSTIGQREREYSEFLEARMRWEEARSRLGQQLERELEARYGLAHRSGVAATPAPTGSARPADDEDTIDSVAAMFTAAEDEHSRQRQEAATNERKRCMWIQFCEGIVRIIEESDDSTAFTNHDLALTIINMKDLDEFMTERARESPTWRRILQTFPRLHTEMVTRFSDFRPLPSVNIDNRMELERLLASTTFDKAMLHKARWYTRLSERLARGAATSTHAAALARLMERVANLSGPSREAAASTRSGAQLTPEEERETRRMEDYLVGGTPITIRREAAASMDAAMRAGADSDFAMSRVRRS